MNIENLCQYNPKLFLKLFGLYIQERRKDLALSVQDASVKIQMSCEALDQIERGEYELNDDDLLNLSSRLFLDDARILNLAKITQVQEIIEVTRELNANFPG